MWGRVKARIARLRTHLPASLTISADFMTQLTNVTAAGIQSFVSFYYLVLFDELDGPMAAQ